MKPPETVKRLIQDTWFNASETMDKALRASIAQANSDGSATATAERKETRRFTMRISITRVALAAMVCGAAVAAAVGGVKLYRYHYEGQNADGLHIFVTEPEVIDEEVIHESITEDANGGTTYNVTTQQTGRLTGVVIRPEDGEEIDVEQTQADLEEIDQLRQQGNRRLVRTVDRETENGPIRINVYEYTLSDGRTITMGEGSNDPGQK